MPALLEAYRAGLLKKGHWLNNVISGVIVAVIALPLGMAFAIAIGAKPEQGIYTSIFAGFIVSVFGGSRLQIAGPTGAFIVILSGITAKYGMTGLQISTIMAGFILVLLGITRMGAIIKYIPAPVIVGFTAGIAVTIWIGQWPNFFNLPEPSGAYFHEKFIHLIESFPQLHIPTTLLSVVSLVLLFVAPHIPGIKKIPAPLLALVLATLVYKIAAESGITGIKTIGDIPIGLPAFKVPSFNLSIMLELVASAFAIAMLGAIESLLSAVVADNMTGTKHNSNQELIGQGLANVVAPFFGGFAATGAIARTAANIKNGGTSPLSGIVHCIVLALILLFFAPLAKDVPLAVLAAILFSVAWNMSQAKIFILMGQRAPKSDVMILIVTFLLTIFVDLVVAVNIGVILAILQFLRRMANSVEVRHIPQEELEAEFKPRGITQSLTDILVIEVEGPIFFGVAENFEQELNQRYNDPSITNPRTMIIDLKRVPFIDFTGLQAMAESIRSIQNKHVRVIITGANSKVDRKFKKAKLLDLVGKENYFMHMLPAMISYQQLSQKLAESDAAAHVITKAKLDEEKVAQEKAEEQKEQEELLKKLRKPAD